MGLMDKVVVFTMFLHIWMCPYTKVEESFNLQAMHDILYHGPDLDKYDHHEFPGVVPRTFLGPLLVSALAYPFVLLAKSFQYDKFFSQVIVRSVLGLLMCFCYGRYRSAVSRKLGRGTGRWLALVTVTQFHFMFYMSRPLPNVFALALALLSLSCWLRGQHGGLIWSAGCGVLVFRGELAMLLGVIVLMEVLQGRLRVGRLLLHAVPAAIFWLGLTVAIDSYFWRRQVWPEGEVLWFNTVLNKSSQWGTSPYLWYIYSVLPRALGCTLLLVPLGWWLDRRSTKILGPALVFVLLYSCLPHKELRFIIYAFPMLNTVAAMACNRIWQNRSKSLWYRFLSLGILFHLVVNLCITGGFSYISKVNYPGGHIMRYLHQSSPNNTAVSVHIDVYTAQTGVSRFTQLHDHWTYDKTEGLAPGSKAMMAFSHLFVEASAEDAPELQPYIKTHRILNYVQGFSHIESQGRKFPPLKIVTTPKIYLLQKLKR